MKIIEIRGYHVAFKLAEPIANSIVVMRSREALLVEVVTDTGITGWGETGASPHAAAAFIRAKLARLLLGQDPAATGRLFHSMAATVGYDRRGAAMMAISALDMALHDAAARAQNVPVSALLGGALRQQMFAYASGPFMQEGSDPYRDFPAETEALLQAGYRAFKPRSGNDPRTDAAAILAMRRQIGDAAALMIDINQGYTARAAIEAARRMEAAGLLWIEEPVQPEDIAGYQTVSAAVGVAISGGEALGSLAAFRDFITARTFSIVQPDLAVCGGFTGMRRVAALADAFDMPVMPHVFGTVVNYYASLQMGAVLTSRRGGGL
ncbi:mandelate racemase/muconate lactonizing enzyme family protein, partial [Acidisphaera sp. L21]|uniref:mandelate racemase/muconate lactonizing enzyme family protein n=1 Tax=Acidisphaera sp. L21 TaxID=1641851 RepID=UPI00131E8630